MGSVLNILRPFKKVDDYFRNKWTIFSHLLDEINRRTQQLKKTQSGSIVLIYPDPLGTILVAQLCTTKWLYRTDIFIFLLFIVYLLL